MRVREQAQEGLCEGGRTARRVGDAPFEIASAWSLSGDDEVNLVRATPDFGVCLDEDVKRPPCAPDCGDPDEARPWRQPAFGAQISAGDARVGDMRSWEHDDLLGWDPLYVDHPCAVRLRDGDKPGGQPANDLSVDPDSASVPRVRPVVLVRNDHRSAARPSDVDVQMLESKICVWRTGNCLDAAEVRRAL